MRPFSVSMGFVTPAIIGEDGVTLDAILLGEKAVRTDDDSAAAWLRQVVAHTDGVPHTSRGFFRWNSVTADGGAIAGGYVGVTKAMIVERELRGYDLPEIPGINGRRKIVKSTLSNVINHYSARNLESVSFFGVGDISEIRLALADVVGIGKLRNSGYGRIDRNTPIQIEEYSDSDPSRHGLVGSNGLPVRQIPMSVWNTLGAGGVGRNARVRVKMARARPPYWDDKTPIEACVVPDHDDLDRAYRDGLFSETEAPDEDGLWS